MIVLKRNTIIVIVVVVVIILAVVGVFGYQQVQQRDALKNIQYSLNGVQVESINLSSATLNLSLLLTNPNSNPATLDRTDFTVFINNISLGSGQNLQKVTIPAGASQDVQILFTVLYKGAAITAWSYLTTRNAEWRLVGTAYFDTLLGTVSVPYNITSTSVSL